VTSRVSVLLALIFLTGAGSDVLAQSADRAAGYQIGAFTDESRAQALMKNLGKRGFYSEVHAKTVRGVTYWVVMVPASDIPFENVRQELLDAGYPSMTLSESEWTRIAPAPPKAP